jgi:hypothetical protein
VWVCVHMWVGGIIRRSPFPSCRACVGLCVAHPASETHSRQAMPPMDCRCTAPRHRCVCECERVVVWLCSFLFRLHSFFHSLSLFFSLSQTHTHTHTHSLSLSLILSLPGSLTTQPSPTLVSQARAVLRSILENRDTKQIFMFLSINASACVCLCVC